MTPRSIEIWTEELPLCWHWSPHNYLGGTPEFYVNTAECLAMLGHSVAVYYDGRVTEKCGVSYMPRDGYQAKDVLIACNSRPPLFADFNIYWTNWKHQTQREVMDFHRRVVLSRFQQQSFGPDSAVIGHACWPEQFKGGVKTPGLCLYSSSPDRGREFLKRIWPEVQRATGARLATTYSQDISDPEMIDLYKQAQFWLHPCQGVELFCISAQKAIAAGCVPVFVPDQALGETVQWGIKTTIETFKADLIEAIRNPPAVPTIKQRDWMDVTRELEALIQ